MTGKYYRAKTTFGRLSFVASVALVLAGCEEGKEFNLFKAKDSNTSALEAPVNSGSKRLVERDIEAPEAFHIKDKGLWDGRPSLGGVWVAHADVKKPDRVIIRNESNGKFIIGALFRRERESPGPRYQVSSDAANALGMLAGQPAKLDVTALHRKEEKEEMEVEAPAPTPDTEPTPDSAPSQQTLDEPEEIKESKLDPIASAAAAIEAADAPTAAATRPKPNPVNASDPATAVAPAAAGAKPLFSMTKPYIQVGLFDQEDAATNAVETLQIAGLQPEIHEQLSGDKTVWRVVVGPTSDRAERRVLRKQIKDLGFTRVIFTAN